MSLLSLQPSSAQRPAPGATAAMDATIINVTDVVVEGVTVYSPAELRRYTEAYRRKAVSLRQLSMLADNLTGLYRKDGYILSQVVLREQQIQQGIVRLQAEEGYIARVNFDGHAPRKRKALAGPIAALQRERPLTAAVLERNLLLINDLAGVTASATLAPLKQGRGAAQLNVRFQQRRYGGSVAISNLASRSLGRVRAQAQVDAYSLLGGFDRTSVQIGSSGKWNALALEHEQPLGANGLKAQAKAKATRSRPGRTGNRNLETRSSDIEAGLSYPVLRSRSKNAYVKGRLTAHNGAIDLPELRHSKDKTRAVRLGASLDSTDRWLGINTVELEFSRGIDGLGASKNGAELSRARGRSDFSKMTLYAARLQSLREQWSLLGAVNGQYAFTDLLVSEQFRFGGEHLGRGYDEAELAGDHGAAVKMELRYSAAKPQAKLDAYTLYGFVDAGKVWQRTPNKAREEKRKESAAAAGVGARMNIGTSTAAFVEVAKPLTREVSQEGNKDARLFAGLNYRF